MDVFNIPLTLSLTKGFNIKLRLERDFVKLSLSGILQ